MTTFCNVWQTISTANFFQILHSKNNYGGSIFAENSTTSTLASLQLDQNLKSTRPACCVCPKNGEKYMTTQMYHFSLEHGVLCGPCKSLFTTDELNRTPVWELQPVNFVMLTCMCKALSLVHYSSSCTPLLSVPSFPLVP